MRSPGEAHPSSARHSAPSGEFLFTTCIRAVLLALRWKLPGTNQWVSVLCLGQPSSGSTLCTRTTAMRVSPSSTQSTKSLSPSGPTTPWGPCLQPTLVTRGSMSSIETRRSVLNPRQSLVCVSDMYPTIVCFICLSYASSASKVVCIIYLSYASSVHRLHQPHGKSYVSSDYRITYY